MVISQGEIWWANLSAPRGSEPGHRRPVVIVQRDSINRSAFQTVLVVPLTSNIKHADIPGNVLLKQGIGGIPRSSLARCTHVMVVDKSRLTEKIGRLSPQKTQEIIQEIIWVMGADRFSTP